MAGRLSEHFGAVDSGNMDVRNRKTKREAHVAIILIMTNLKEQLDNSMISYADITMTLLIKI